MIYFIIFLFLAILSLIMVAKLPADFSWFIFFFVGLVLICFTGLRGNIEGDYASYKDIFEQSVRKYSSDANTEPGYFYFNKLILNFGLPFQVVVFLMAFFSIIPKLYFFKKHSTNFALSVLIYYSAFFFTFDFIEIRQALAIAIFMISLHYIYERKFWLYFLCIFCAALIHISVLIVLPGYFIFNRKYSKNALYIAIAVCAVINVLQLTVPLVQSLLGIIPVPGFTESKIAFYQKLTVYSQVTFKQLIFAAIFIFLRDGRNSDGKLTNILVNLYVIGVILATCFNELAELSFRIKWYFFWTESVLIVYLVRYLSKYSVTIIYSTYLLLFILYLYSLYSLLTEFASRDSGYIFPYKFFFQ